MELWLSVLFTVFYRTAQIILGLGQSTGADIEDSPRGITLSKGLKLPIMAPDSYHNLVDAHRSCQCTRTMHLLNLPELLSERHELIIDTIIYWNGWNFGHNGMRG